jgi:SAM-dependent methyltransferase
MTDPNWGRRADRLAAEALAEGRPTAWFDRLYAEARRGEVAMPWDREGPHPLLVRWAASRRALVVGCGLGTDAEFVASLGYATEAFDVSASAIAEIRARRPDSPVRYHVADLLDLPADWRGAFDLVVESYTVQALPVSVRARAIAAVRDLVSPGGTLVVIADARGDADPLPVEPPWPLTREELDTFATAPLHERTATLAGELWLAEFVRAHDREERRHG